MNLKRQIEFDKHLLKGLKESITKTKIRFNETLELVAKLNKRLNRLSESKKDYEIRISVRESKL